MQVIPKLQMVNPFRSNDQKDLGNARGSNIDLCEHNTMFWKLEILKARDPMIFIQLKAKYDISVFNSYIG
jgi:hypothetical protein